MLCAGCIWEKEIFLLDFAVLNRVNTSLIFNIVVQ